MKTTRRHGMLYRLAVKNGWKLWGNSNNPKGQCFRRGNTYMWVGDRYIQKSVTTRKLDHSTVDQNRILNYIS